MRIFHMFLVLLMLSAAGVSQAKEYFFVEINGVISGYTDKYIEKSLADASANDGVLVIKLDTPGGLLDSTRKIVQKILESETPVVTFVSPQGARAGSAGTFITLASHFAAMAEGCNIGAAHPVNITGQNIEGEMAKKVENDTVAFIRSIAEKRGRNLDIAVQTVTNSLSLTSQEALDSGLIDAVVNSDDELVKILSEKFGAETKRTYLEPTVLQEIAFFLSDPNILMLMLFIGIAAIFLEFKMPGTFVFAGIGICAILLFLMGINIIPVNMLGLLLIFAGLTLLIAEVFIPSFGLLTLGAVTALGFGMYLLFSREGNMGIGVSAGMIISVLAVVALITGLVGRLIMKDFLSRPATGAEGMIGEKGRVMSWSGASGKVFVHGEIWNAESAESFEKGDDVAIKEIKGMVIKVERAE
jgi:membrane-bound serine protease (ClpP class)